MLAHEPLGNMSLVLCIVYSTFPGVHTNIQINLTAGGFFPKIIKNLQCWALFLNNWSSQVIKSQLLYFTPKHEGIYKYCVPGAIFPLWPAWQKCINGPHIPGIYIVLLYFSILFMMDNKSLRWFLTNEQILHFTVTRKGEVNLFRAPGSGYYRLIKMLKQQITN